MTTATPPVRRMMVEYGEQFWKHRWGPLYSVLGGNPLAAMPSLHFATSVNAAHLLAESGRVEGAVGWTYALTLGLALVYLGEHYVVDLLAGLALTESVRALAPVAGSVVRARRRRRAGDRGQGPGVGRMAEDAVERATRLQDRVGGAARRAATGGRGAAPPRRGGDAARRADAASRDPVRRLRARVDRVPVLRAAADRRREGRVRESLRRRQGLAGGRRSASSCCRSPATSRCSTASTCRRARRSRTATAT